MSIFEAALLSWTFAGLNAQTEGHCGNSKALSPKLCRVWGFELLFAALLIETQSPKTTNPTTLKP